MICLSFLKVISADHIPRTVWGSTSPGDVWLGTHTNPVSMSSMLVISVVSSASAITQAPSVKKARMYKVLKEVVEDHQSGSKTEGSAA